MSAELYSLQTVFAVFIALALLACPAWGQHVSCRGLAQLGLLLLAVASFLNGLYIHAPLAIFLAGRALAGVGVGLVIYFAPRLLDSRWENPTTWASILLPVAGPARDRGPRACSRLVGLAVGVSDRGGCGPVQLARAALHGERA